MTVKTMMQAHGFERSESGGGCEWYTNGAIFNGKKVFIAVTDADECGIPQELDDPIKADIYDIVSGALISEVTTTLNAFLKSLEGIDRPV